MQQTYINHIGEHEGKVVELRGWLYRNRKGGKIQFLQVRDGTGIIQAIVTKENEAVFETAKTLTTESSIIIRGEVKADDRSSLFQAKMRSCRNRPSHCRMRFPL